MKIRPSALALITTALFGQIVNGEETLASSFPDFNAFQAEVTRTGELDFDGGPGSLSVTSYEARFILSKPIELFSGVQMLPIFSYEVNYLDFDHVLGTPFQDEEFYSATLQAMFFKSFEGTNWMGLAWTRAEFASDYQEINSDDFTFDVAIGAAYRFSDRFILGLGVLATDLNGEDQIWWGLNFHWVPTDQIQVGLYGPNLNATYSFNEDWFISLNGSPNGGVWNFRDNVGQSRSLELNQYLIGVNTHHRIHGELWFSAGIGYALPSEVQIRGNTGGNPQFSRDTDGAPYAQIGLQLRRW